MIESKTKVIDGLKYTVTQLGAKKGMRALTRLARLLGPAFASGDQTEAMAGLFSRLTEDDVEYFCDTFAPLTTVEQDGKAPQLSSIFEIHFTGNYSSMLQWLLFCIEVNFGDFFGGRPDDNTKG